MKMFNMLKSDKLIRVVIKDRKNPPLLFERIADDFFKPSFTNEIQSSSFNVDILTDENHYYILADLPGCNSDNLVIRADNQYLTIEVHPQNIRIYSKTSCIRRERAEGSLSRRFLIETVDFEKMTYEIVDGLLTLTLPKKII